MMARTSRAQGRSGGRNSSRTSYRSGTIEIFTRPHQNPYLRVVGWIVRFRAELTCIAVILTITLVLRDRIGPANTALALGFVTVMVIGIPASRRYITARCWAVTTRHRMRACFGQTRTMTHDGKMPLLLWSRPSPVGERVRVWLPAGLSVKDIDQVTDRISTACWARTTRVTPVRAQAALVVVDVVRRDPLTVGDIVPTGIHDLADLTETEADEHITPEDTGNVVALPSRDTLTGTGTTAPTPPAEKKPGRTSGKNATARRPADDEDADPSL